MESSVAPPLGSRSTGIVKDRSGSISLAISVAPQDLMPYHQYRARQRSTQGESVWDDELEAAFMEAIQVVPRLGPGNVYIDGKPCGRNVLISEYIYKRTGKRRTRKQVSSHIQMLKVLLGNSPEFMRHATTGEPKSWETESPGDMEVGSRGRAGLPPTIPINIASTQFGGFDGSLGTDTSIDTNNWETKQHQFPITPYGEPCPAAGEDKGGYCGFGTYRLNSFSVGGGQQVLDNLSLPSGQYQTITEMEMGNNISAGGQQVLGDPNLPFGQYQTFTEMEMGNNISAAGQQVLGDPNLPFGQYQTFTEMEMGNNISAAGQQVLGDPNLPFGQYQTFAEMEMGNNISAAGQQVLGDPNLPFGQYQTFAEMEMGNNISAAGQQVLGDPNLPFGQYQTFTEMGMGNNISTGGHQVLGD